MGLIHKIDKSPTLKKADRPKMIDVKWKDDKALETSLRINGSKVFPNHGDTKSPDIMLFQERLAKLGQELHMFLKFILSISRAQSQVKEKSLAYEAEYNFWGRSRLLFYERPKSNRNVLFDREKELTDSKGALGGRLRF